MPAIVIHDQWENQRQKDKIRLLVLGILFRYACAIVTSYGGNVWSAKLIWREMEDPVLFAINPSDQNLYTAFASIIVHAIGSWYLIKWECAKRRLTSAVGRSKKHAGYIVSAVVFLLGVIRHSCVGNAIDSQPTWTPFHCNAIFVVGRLTMLLGLVLLCSCIHAKGAAQCLICVHYDLFGDSFTGAIFPYNVLTEPITVASLLIYAGYSLLSASLVGVLLSLLMAVNHCNRPFLARSRSRW